MVVVPIVLLLLCGTVAPDVFLFHTAAASATISNIQ